MRLIVTIIWSIGAICWIPWFLVFIRLLVDIASGIAPDASPFLPLLLKGLWPRWQILGPWYINSWYPRLRIPCIFDCCGWMADLLVQRGISTYETYQGNCPEHSHSTVGSIAHVHGFQAAPRQ